MRHSRGKTESNDQKIRQQRDKSYNSRTIVLYVWCGMQKNKKKIKGMGREGKERKKMPSQDRSLWGQSYKGLFERETHLSSFVNAARFCFWILRLSCSEVSRTLQILPAISYFIMKLMVQTGRQASDQTECLVEGDFWPAKWKFTLTFKITFGFLLRFNWTVVSLNLWFRQLTESQYSLMTIMKTQIEI